MTQLLLLCGAIRDVNKISDGIPRKNINAAGDFRIIIEEERERGGKGRVEGEGRGGEGRGRGQSN